MGFARTFWHSLFERDPDPSDLNTILHDTPLFAELTSSEMRQIIRLVHQRHYEPGERVFGQSDPGLGVYIIKKGEVRIVSRTGEVVREIALLRDGDFFGELSLLDEGPRAGTAFVTEPTEVISFFRPDLLTLMSRAPRLGVKLILRLSAILAERLRRVDAQTIPLRTELDRLRRLAAQPVAEIASSTDRVPVAPDSTMG